MIQAAPPLDLRPADEEDLIPLARLWAVAFPGERSVADRARRLQEGGAYGGLETAWVVERNGRLAGAFRAFELALHLFGRSFPTLGLAALAVDPAFRRQGVGTALCRAALRLGRDRGDLLCALFPFRVDFYARLGFTLTGEFHRYRFPPASLPLFPEGDRICMLSPDRRRPRVPEFYASLLPRLHGAAHRTGAMWTFLDEEDIQVWGLPSKEGKGLAGYMVTDSRPPRRSRGAELRIRELLVEDADGYRAFLGWLSGQRDQWAEITYDALPGERLQQVLSHPRLPGTGLGRGLWFPSATILRGPMLRVLRLAEVLDRLGLEEGSVLDVRDAELPENAGRWTGTGDGPPERVRDQTGEGGLPISLLTGLIAEGDLPGLAAPRSSEFVPAMGIRDFRILDVF